MQHDLRDDKGNFASTITDDELWSAYIEEPSSKKVAKRFGLSVSQARKRLAKIREKMGLVHSPDVDRAGKLEQMLASVPLTGPDGARLKAVDVKLWGIGAKDELTQQIITQGLDGIQARYKLQDDKPEWPPILPASPSPQIVTYKPLPQAINPELERVWVLGDVQIGYWRNEDDTYTPFHDLAAIDVALQSLARYQPHKIVIIGDFIDFPDLSKWEQIPEFEGCMGKSIEYANHLLEQIRATCPDAEIHYLMGNHETRLTRSVANRLRPFYKLRRPGDSHDLVSIPFLLNFEKHKILVSDEYPGGQVWISDNIVCTHAPPVNRHDVRAHVIYGHHVEEAVKSYKTYYPEGAQVYKTYCVPGLSDYADTKNDKVRLCRSNVPSNRTRISATQAFATVDIVRGIDLHKVNVWEIRDGSVLFYDNILTAKSVLLEEAA